MKYYNSDIDYYKDHLEHSGVVGMRWGHRKQKPPKQLSASKQRRRQYAINAIAYKGKADKFNSQAINERLKTLKPGASAESINKHEENIKKNVIQRNVADFQSNTNVLASASKAPSTVMLALGAGLSAASLASKDMRGLAMIGAPLAMAGLADVSLISLARHNADKMDDNKGK